MKKLLLSTICLVSALFICATPVLALEDPLSKPNNKIGIHILFDSELSDAAKLVNANGGDWGYVLIPLQAGDRDLVKWQKFLDEAGQKHLIPIIRLATEGDYFNTHVWRRPREEDILDFANFLNSLTWPTKNRYVIIFNEVNRGDEWGGAADPSEYAKLLSYAVTVFKTINQDFFVISSGMDNAAPNQAPEYINQYSFFAQMNTAVPGIFNQVDGFSSHSYPNPGFSQPPTINTSKSISSFQHERTLIRQMSSKRLPIFITETGWTNETVSEEARAKYYNQAFKGAWADSDIVTVIPFILKASGPFAKFSFLKEDGTETKQYESIKSMTKTKGLPTLVKRVLAAQTVKEPSITKEFKVQKEKQNAGVSASKAFQAVFGWVMRL